MSLMIMDYHWVLADIPYKQASEEGFGIGIRIDFERMDLNFLAMKPLNYVSVPKLSFYNY